MLNQKCFMVNLLQSMILSYSIYHQSQNSCVLNLIQLIIITLITLGLILLQNVFNKFMLQGTIICIELDMFCLIIMNIHNFGRIPFSQIIIAQILIKDLFLDFKLGVKSELYAFQAIIPIFLLVYSYFRIEFDREQPQLLATLIISLYCNSSLPKQSQPQMTSMITEITNTNKQDILNSKRNVSQFDLDQNQNSLGMRETSTTADNGIQETSIQCFELLQEGVILLVPESNTATFPYSIKYVNQATKLLFNRETDQEVLQFIDGLNTFQLFNGEPNEDLLFVSQYQRQPSLHLFRQTTESKDQPSQQQRNLTQDVQQVQDRNQKFKIKQIIETLLKSKTQECVVVQAQLNTRFTLFTTQQIQTSQTYINTESNQLIELTLTLSKNQYIIIICRDVTHRQKLDIQRSMINRSLKCSHLSVMNIVLHQIVLFKCQNVYLNIRISLTILILMNNYKQPQITRIIFQIYLMIYQTWPKQKWEIQS